VTAPYDGVIVDTLIEQGEMVAPGRPLLKIEGAGALEFETVVNESDVRSLAIGQPVSVSLDSVAGELAGTISEIVTTSDAGTHTNIVRALLKTKTDLRSGMFGRIRFPQTRGGEAAILIPEDRLVRQGQLSAVYLVDPSQTLRLRLVREGKTSAGRVEILSGLSPADRIVVSDISGLIDGQPAKVVDR
jgi:RND family efflux transporter MFP subunit